jgi:hypothetical protein
VQQAGGSFTPQSMTDWVYGTQQGTPTLAAQQQQFLQGLQSGQLTGVYNGAPTLEAALQSAGLTGMYQGAPTLQAQQQAFQQAMSQQGLGLQALQTAAGLKGPENWVQAANYARGVQQTDTPAFLNALLSGQTGPAAMQGVGLSNPLTFGSLASSLGANGGGSSAPTNTNPALDQARALFSAGGAALSPQALEAMTSTEQQMLGSLGGAVGADMPTFLQQYKNSRIGQGAAQSS